MFHQQSGPVYDALARLRQNLERAGIDYVVIGAFALGAHNYDRATTDIDLCLRESDLRRFKTELVGPVYGPVEGRPRRFLDLQTRTTFDLLVSGALAGRTSRNKVIRFPDPSEAVEVRGLRTVSLPRLVELKLVTWRYRDWADVVELIRRNGLDEAFSQQLHPLIQMAYLQCYDQMLEEDRYDQEQGGH